MPALRWTLFAVLVALILTGGCLQQPIGCPGPDPLAVRIDRGLDAGARYLAARQAPDGAWYSEVYGPFKDGASLTPAVVQALRAAPATPDRAAAARRGIAYLAGFVRPDGTIEPGPHGFSYHVYTAAGVVALLSPPDQSEHAQGRDAWLSYLRQRQLTEDLGWRPEDREYGGWGFCAGLPRKPPAGQLVPPLTESNLSATLFALEALRAAGVPADDPAVKKALVFVERCQNFGADLAFDDGGFFFIYDDGVRNKAGVAGQDEEGRERYFSYGSTTADGLRALLACGLPADHPRVAAARRWLETHFRADTHPGRYAEPREPNREAVYYYYAWSVATAFAALEVRELDTPAGKVRWAEVLAEELLKRQRNDGAWVNPAVLVREDDPLVATPLAVRALAVCRARLADGANK